MTQGAPCTGIEVLRITGDEEKDTAALNYFGTIDTVLDLSSPATSQSPHLNSAIAALLRKGRTSLMGGFNDGPIPSLQLVFKDITVSVVC